MVRKFVRNLVVVIMEMLILILLDVQPNNLAPTLFYLSSPHLPSYVLIPLNMIVLIPLWPPTSAINLVTTISTGTRQAHLFKHSLLLFFKFLEMSFYSNGAFNYRLGCRSSLLLIIEEKENYVIDCTFLHLFYLEFVIKSL
jgi:hypothetical protein